MCEHKNTFYQSVSKGASGISMKRVTCTDCGEVTERENKGIIPHLEAGILLGGVEGVEYLLRFVEDVLFAKAPRR